MWLKSSQVKKILGLSNQALYQRRLRNTIKWKKVDGVYFYWLNDYKEEERYVALYCRVSNTKQKEDLKRQEKLLKEYAISNGHVCKYVFSDIASGMNENRKGFNELLNLIFENKISKVIISYKDRLTRFGFGYFEEIFSKFGTEIEVVNLTQEEDFQEELTNDLISIIHHFSMKIYSKRRSQLKQLEEDLKNDNI